MKTKVYITLGIIMNLILLGAPLLFTGWHIFFAYLGSLSYLILSVIICATNDLYSESLYRKETILIYTFFVIPASALILAMIMMPVLHAMGIIK